MGENKIRQGHLLQQSKSPLVSSHLDFLSHGLEESLSAEYKGEADAILLGLKREEEVLARVGRDLNGVDAL